MRNGTMVIARFAMEYFLLNFLDDRFGIQAYWFLTKSEELGYSYAPLTSQESSLK